MNWFERYGIVGMFFIVMTGMWFFCLFPEARALLNNSNPELPKYIGGFCGLSFLPFGYIIMACSQIRCYSKNGINCRLWIDLLDEQKKKILELEKELGGFNQTDEAQLEAITTYYDRTNKAYQRTNKSLSVFLSKRFDVIAINNGLRCALIFSFFAAICIGLIILDVPIKWNTFSTWFVIVLTLLIVRVLRLLNRILEGQIYEISRRKFRHLKLISDVI